MAEKSRERDLLAQGPARVVGDVGWDFIAGVILSKRQGMKKPDLPVHSSC